MAAGKDTLQRIERLTPLREVLSHITSSLAPLEPVEMALADATERVAAEDVVLSEPLPPAAIALIDGYAVAAETTADASAYAPMPLAVARRIDAGQPLPRGADAVIGYDAVISDAVGVQALAPVAPGEGILPRGADVRPGEALQLAGMQLRLVDLAVLVAAGLTRIAVRAPRVRIVAARADTVLGQIVAMIATLVRRSGGEVLPCGAADPAAALASEEAHVVVVVGGSGEGSDDRSVQTLARLGRVDVHGVAIGPGQSSALGAVGDRTVLVLPGRIDAALAAWLLIGVPLMRQLTHATEDRPSFMVRLERKIASTIGLLELVPVRVHEEKAMPLASGYLPLRALSQANAYILVPAESEGYPEGVNVSARLIP